MNLFILDSFSLQNLALDQVQRLKIRTVEVATVKGLLAVHPCKFFFISPFMADRCEIILGQRIKPLNRAPILGQGDMFLIFNLVITGGGVGYNFIAVEVRK